MRVRLLVLNLLSQVNSTLVGLLFRAFLLRSNLIFFVEVVIHTGTLFRYASILSLLLDGSVLTAGTESPLALLQRHTRGQKLHALEHIEHVLLVTDSLLIAVLVYLLPL